MPSIARSSSAPAVRLRVFFTRPTAASNAAARRPSRRTRCHSGSSPGPACARSSVYDSASSSLTLRVWAALVTSVEHGLSTSEMISDGGIVGNLRATLAGLEEAACDAGFSDSDGSDGLRRLGAGRGCPLAWGFGRVLFWPEPAPKSDRWFLQSNTLNCNIVCEDGSAAKSEVSSSKFSANSRFPTPFKNSGRSTSVVADRLTSCEMRGAQATSIRKLLTNAQRMTNAPE